MVRLNLFQAAKLCVKGTTEVIKKAPHPMAKKTRRRGLKTTIVGLII